MHVLLKLLTGRTISIGDFGTAFSMTDLYNKIFETTGMVPQEYFLTINDEKGCLVLTNETLMAALNGKSEATLIMNGKLLSCGMFGGCEKEAAGSYNDEMLTEESRRIMRMGRFLLNLDEDEFEDGDDMLDELADNDI